MRISSVVSLALLSFACGGTGSVSAGADGGPPPDAEAWAPDAAAAEADAGPGAPDAAPLPDAAQAADSGGPAPAAPLFGTPHSPNNRPISDWEADIRAHYGVADVVDALATADLQECIAQSGTWGAPYAIFGQDSYSIYFARAGDPEYPIADGSGNTRVCPLDSGKGWTGVRIPVEAHVWSAADNAAITSPDDTHITIIDRERNRVYAFYAYSGSLIGLDAGKWRSPYRGCDLLSADGPDGPGDSAIAAASSAAARYACAGGAGYPAAGCGLEGIGAGISIGQGFGNGDSNGFLGPHGVIMPEDFDDTGWSGEAVGTLHHALRCSNPNDYQHGYIWPMQDPAAGTPGRYLRDGQIIRLDPAVDLDAIGGLPAHERRVLRTLQVYGCVLSDYARYGMALFAQSAWDGTGPQRGANPWTAEGGANAQAQALYAGANASGIKFDLLPHLDMTRLQVVLPHGAAHPAR